MNIAERIMLIWLRAFSLLNHLPLLNRNVRDSMNQQLGHVTIEIENSNVAAIEVIEMNVPKRAGIVPDPNHETDTSTNTYIKIFILKITNTLPLKKILSKLHRKFSLVHYFNLYIFVFLQKIEVTKRSISVITSKRSPWWRPSKQNSKRNKKTPQPKPQFWSWLLRPKKPIKIDFFFTHFSFADSLIETHQK